MTRTMPETLRGIAAATLAAGCLFIPVAAHAQSTAGAQSAYQGVSQPPPDDTIEATPEAAPTAPRTKPSPGVPANTAAASAANSDDNTDNGIVTEVPGSPRAAAMQPAQPPSSSREMHLIPRPENPDYGIVTMAPSPSNQLAEGTDIRVRLMQALSTSTTQDGAPFRAQVAADVYKEGRVVIPIGSELRGRVMSVTQGHRMGSPATMRLRPEAVLLPDGTSYHLYAQAIRTDAPGTRTDSEGALQPSSRVQKNLLELGAGSGGGAATGAVFGGPAGAAAGAIVGAGLVTAHLLLQHPGAAHVEQGSEITFSLTEPMDLLPTRN